MAAGAIDRVLVYRTRKNADQMSRAEIEPCLTEPVNRPSINVAPRARVIATVFSEAQREVIDICNLNSRVEGLIC